MTAMGREFELKYRADSGMIAAVRAAFGDFSEIRMETVYYDTLDAALSRRRWMLRRRYENGTSVCTLKTPLPDGSRGEWETPCDDIGLAVKELCKLGAPEDLLPLTAGGLTGVCSARFTRLAKQIVLERCTVELALDEGALMGGGEDASLRRSGSGTEIRRRSRRDCLCRSAGTKIQPDPGTQKQGAASHGAAALRTYRREKYAQI